MSYTWRGMLPSSAPRGQKLEIQLVPPQSIIWLEIKTDLVKFVFLKAAEDLPMSGSLVCNINQPMPDIT